MTLNHTPTPTHTCTPLPPSGPALPTGPIPCTSFDTQTYSKPRSGTGTSVGLTQPGLSPPACPHSHPRNCSHQTPPGRAHQRLGLHSPPQPQRSGWALGATWAVPLHARSCLHAAQTPEPANRSSNTAAAAGERARTGEAKPWQEAATIQKRSGPEAAPSPHNQQPTASNATT